MGIENADGAGSFERLLRERGYGLVL